MHEKCSSLSTRDSVADDVCSALRARQVAENANASKESSFGAIDAGFHCPQAGNRQLIQATWQLARVVIHLVRAYHLEGANAKFASSDGSCGRLIRIETPTQAPEIPRIFREIWTSATTDHTMVISFVLKITPDTLPHTVKHSVSIRDLHA